MSDPKWIPGDRDDEWREADSRPEDRVLLREKPDRRKIERNDTGDSARQGEDDSR